MGRRRGGGPNSLGSLADGERERLYVGFTEEQRAQMEDATRQRSVYDAWNAVCGNTREGSHVTGLHYVAASNELVVYLDGASWTQEMTMMREIIRARMSIKGVDVDDIVFKTSRPGYTRGGFAAPAPRPEETGDGAGQIREPLSEEERGEVAEAVRGISDDHLKKAAERAMTASLEWQKHEEKKKSS